MPPPGCGADWEGGVFSCPLKGTIVSTRSLVLRRPKGRPTPPRTRLPGEPFRGGTAAFPSHSNHAMRRDLGPRKSQKPRKGNRPTGRTSPWQYAEPPCGNRPSNAEHQARRPRKKQPFVGGAGTYEGRTCEGNPSHIANYDCPIPSPQPLFRGKWFGIRPAFLPGMLPSKEVGPRLCPQPKSPLQ